MLPDECRDMLGKKLFFLTNEKEQSLDVQIVQQKMDGLKLLDIFLLNQKKIRKVP